MKKHLFAVTTALLLICAMPIAAAHAEPEVDVVVTEPVVEEYSYTISITSDLSFNGSSATCKSKVRGNSDCTKIVATQRLQKKTSDGWSDVHTWYLTEYSDTLSMTNYATVTEKGTFRVRIDAIVYSGSSYEHANATSPEVTKGQTP